MKRPKILAVSLALAAAAVCVAAVLYFRSGTHPAGAREGLVVYIGTYGNHLYRYIFDASDGGFTPLGQAEVRNPSYIALGEENMRDGIYDIYAVSESGDSSGVFSFADNIGISRTGDAVTGEDPCYILFDNACSLVMTADYSGGSVSVFRVNDDGSVGEKLRTLRFEGSGPVPGRQESSHIHQLKFLPASASGRYLLAADLGADRIRILKLERNADKVSASHPGDSALAYIPGLDVDCGAGSGPRHMAVDTLRHRVYCLTEISGELLVFDYSFNVDGQPVLSLSDRIEIPEAQGGGSADIHLHPSGRFLYTSHRLRKDGIALFTVADDGTLSRTAYYKTRRHPRNFCITPDGSMLMVASRDEKSVDVYDIDPETGCLDYSGARLRFEEDMPSCIVIAE